MGWFDYTILFSFSVASLIMAMRAVDARVNPFLFMGCALTFAVTILFLYSLTQHFSFAITTPDLFAAIIGGFAGAMVDVCYMMVFRRNAPVSLAIPIIRVASILLTALIGLSFFGDTITPVKSMGIITACVAIFLLRKNQLKEQT